MVEAGHTTVFVAEDHPLFLAGITGAIRLRPELEFVGSSMSGREAVDAVRTLRPDVLVLDLRLPDFDGHAVINAITRDALPVRVLVLSAHVESDVVYDALAAGANGFLSKLMSERAVCDAILAVARGETVIPQELQSGLVAQIRDRGAAERPRLSDRERAILRMLADGLTAPKIAENLHLSPATVRTHLHGIYEKLSVSTQAAAVAAGLRLGLLD